MITSGDDINCKEQAGSGRFGTRSGTGTASWSGKKRDPASIAPVVISVWTALFGLYAT